MADQGRPAALADVHELALSLPHVTRVDGSAGRPVYQVGPESFIFFRHHPHFDGYPSVLLRPCDLVALVRAKGLDRPVS